MNTAHKVSINLLPSEFTTGQLKKQKFYKVQAIGIGIILFMIFLSSLTFALQVLQNQKLSGLQNQLVSAEGKVSQFQETEASLVILKNRLGGISKYVGVSSKQTELFKLINNLLPQSLIVSQLSVDKSGNILITAVTTDSFAVDQFIDSLTSQETNEGKINTVVLDNFVRGGDGIFRLGFRITPK